jgi:hypothetical protein
MISAAKLAANRANAQKSTGPRTAAGKLRSAQNPEKSTGPRTAAGKQRSARNALRHGLASHWREPGFAESVTALAKAIAGGTHDTQLMGLAPQIAAAEIDLMRARRARLDLVAEHSFDNIARLAAIECYEGNARLRRKIAIRAFDAAAAAEALPPKSELTERTNPTCARFLQNELTHRSSRRPEVLGAKRRASKGNPCCILRGSPGSRPG